MLVPERLGIALQQPWHNGPIKNEIDRAWLAGLIDADGCIGIRREDNGKWNPSYIPYITVSCSDVPLVQRCAEITGLGKVNLKSHAGDTDKRGIKQRRDGYVWRLDGQIASRVIRDIFPYLVQKRGQANLCNAMNVSQAEVRPSKANPVAPSIVSYRQMLYESIKGLNQRRQIDLPDLPPIISNMEPGWWVRSHIIWAKKNCMPESCTDRPTSAHETIWVLTKSARYYWDGEAVKEDAAGTVNAATFRGGGAYTNHQTFNNSNSVARGSSGNVNHLGSRKLRNVWTFASHPYPGAHFATFPPELAERCIKAGSPRGGQVLDPFAGAGTTGLVADRLGRDCTLIDLNTEYIKMAINRIKDDAPLFAEIAAE
jgi:hypothetical protein